MAIIVNNTSKGSCHKSIGEVALALKAEENDSSPTIVPVWSLEPAGTEAVDGEELIAINESIVGGSDERTLVDPKLYAPNGKYRCTSCEPIGNGSF